VNDQNFAGWTDLGGSYERGLIAIAVLARRRKE
jgi:hypothetical protein